MRKLIVSVFVTLDGIMQAPGGPEEHPDGGFEHGGWAFGYWDDVVDETMHTSMADPFDLLLGRKTYEILRRPLAAQRGAGRRTLKSVEWQNTQLLEGPLADAVNGVKAQDGTPPAASRSSTRRSRLGRDHDPLPHGRGDKGGSFAQAELDRRATQ